MIFRLNTVNKKTTKTNKQQTNNKRQNTQKTKKTANKSKNKKQQLNKNTIIIYIYIYILCCSFSFSYFFMLISFFIFSFFILFLNIYIFLILYFHLLSIFLRFSIYIVLFIFIHFFRSGFSEAWSFSYFLYFCLVWGHSPVFFEKLSNLDISDTKCIQTQISKNSKTMNVDIDNERWHWRWQLTVFDAAAEVFEDLCGGGKSSPPPQGFLFSRPWVCDRRIVGIELFGPPRGTKLLLLLFIVVPWSLKLIVNFVRVFGAPF